MDYRYDQFADESTKIDVTNELHMIPLASPFVVMLREVPDKASPSTLSMRVCDFLAAAIASSGTTSATVLNGTWFANDNVLTIDSEQVLVTNVATNVLTITRGYNSTVATTHDINSQVFIESSMSEVAAAPTAGQFWPDYSTGADGDENWNTGAMLFNESDAGKMVSADYKATGTLASDKAPKTYPAISNDLGDGSDGHFISSGSDTIDGLKQYKSFIVQAGHTVTVGANPLHILCQGPVIIDGTIDGSGSAGGTTTSGTATGGAGKGGGGGGGSVVSDGVGDISASYDGGNASGAGGGNPNGGTGNLMGAIIAAAAAVAAGLANIAARLLMPSAGGGGGSATVGIRRGGGGGGGSVVLVGRNVYNTGTITTTGGAIGDTVSGSVGAGGGGGASIRIVAELIKLTGTITVAGGKGGDGASTGTATAGGAGWTKTIETGD